MAKYRCKVSGNIIELTAPVDIISMQGHEGYEEVVEAKEDKKSTLSLPKEEKQSKGK